MTETAGDKLRASVLDSMPAGVELDERELSILDLACSQADDLALIEAAIEEGGATVQGSAGQPVLNPAVAEARQCRAAIARLLKQIERTPAASVSAAARRAANARWGKRTTAANPGSVLRVLPEAK